MLSRPCHRRAPAAPHPSRKYETQSTQTEKRYKVRRETMSIHGLPHLYVLECARLKTMHLKSTRVSCQQYSPQEREKELGNRDIEYI